LLEGKSGALEQATTKDFKFIPSDTSHLEILEHPITDSSGIALKNLYCIGIDSIDIGKRETSENTDDPSNFAVIVFKRMKGMDPPKVVAIYKDRPQ